MYKQIIRTFKPDGRTVTSIEKRYTFMGNYGAKGEKRRKKEKPTPEQVEYQNRMNRARRYRYWIKANFTTEDIFTTLTYGPGERKPIEEVQKDFKRFWRRLRARYEKMGIPLKLIYVIEIGSHGGMHVHLIVNECGCTAKLISELWTHGHPNYKQLYEEGDDRASHPDRDNGGEHYRGHSDRGDRCTTADRRGHYHDNFADRDPAH